MNSIKDMVKDGKKVKFQFYKQNELWYVTECGFEFPVPIEDCGDGTFLAEDKAMLFMRYIRKHIKYLDDAIKESGWSEPYHVTGTDNPIDFPTRKQYLDEIKNVADFPGGPLEYPEDFD